MPHTYQVRDFVPKLATGDGALRHQRLHRLQERRRQTSLYRQMFQGKLAADVSFACDAPWFVTFQNGAFRGDKVEAGTAPAPVETVNVEIAEGVSATSRRKSSRKPNRPWT
jgi:electron transfer flavoprotein alpha subunit